MKKSDVQIGAVYRVKLQGRMCDVKIRSEAKLVRGWQAWNLTLNRPVFIRYATYLRYEVLAERDRVSGPDYKQRAAGDL